MSVDSITAEVVQSHLVSICEEMGVVMVRTAYSPIFSEGRDYSTALFDAGPELLAQGTGCPAQLGALQLLVGWCIDELGLETFAPGDVVLHNDVYRGGTHLPEFTMIAPAFAEGELLGFVTLIAHHADIGGKSPGGFPGDATDVHQEGFRLPPVKLFDRGRPNLEVWQIVLSNTRVPEMSFGDIAAMRASVMLGVDRLAGLKQRYGAGLQELLEEVKDYSERRMRRELELIPDGVYHGADWMEDDGVTAGGPYEIRVAITVSGDFATVDFTGSAPQVRGPINCPFGVTASATYNAFFQLTSPDIPANGGCYRPIRIVSPTGLITNVEYPGAQYGGNTETHNRIVDAIVGAFADALPERVTGAGASTCTNFTYGGRHPRTGEMYANYQWEVAGWGARSFADGNSAVIAPVGNSPIQSLEVIETRFPWRHVSYGLAAGSGGRGRFRGGLGTVRVMEVTAAEIEVSGLADRHLRGAPGRLGGEPGAPGAYLVQRAGEAAWQTFPEAFGSKSRSKFANCVLSRGDRVMIVSPGGGGYGPPGERLRERLERDRDYGYAGGDPEEPA